MAIKILISDKIESVCPAILKEAGFEVDEKSGLSPADLEAVIGDYDGQIVRSATKVTEEVLKKGKAGKLKIVGRAGAGVDNIDTKAAEALGIKVVNTPGLNSNAVAELAVAFMFVLSRNLGPAIGSMKEGRWEKKALSRGFELSGKTVGLVGYGSIGSLVAKKALGLGMKVLAFDPLVSDDKMKSEGVTPSTLENLFKESDHVSLHLPKNKDTLNLVNGSVLKTFKKTACLVNCARGGLVDEKALFEALKNGDLAGAAFDVFAEEPPTDNALRSLPNFVSAPHLGASTVEAQLGVAKKVAELLVEHLKK
ncbi:MAG: hydroxyacid dehydrogenase [Deltaproteobacteria bacterium]|jgi:D-3-phosphoglycerate dehydrogenase|nr:hydroxyacid dehydrogenase [Deltaproteobacteria bacterium]